jgi:hypothetical protein
MLAPTAVEGFVLETKKWASFAISQLQVHQHDWDSEALSTVYLDESVINPLKEDFMTYFAQRRSFLASGERSDLDLVGRRLVLHGEYIRKKATFNSDKLVC